MTEVENIDARTRLEMYGMITPAQDKLHSWALTEEGRNYLEKKEKVVQKESMNISINGDNNVIQANNAPNSSQGIITSNIDFDEVQKVLGCLLSSIEEFGKQGPELEENINSAKNAITKKNEGLLKKAMDGIKSILENATGSAMATVVLDLISKISGLS